ncbi:hypothetical protein [Mycobacterium sp. E1747]|uniref:hypothetical protein n=1 Tax=Mycobacterium sp. E1747 TaxID=1834128 RepID=UPI0012EA6495|nr:hypothetical protein [Mycobacterium sp. E1747]
MARDICEHCPTNDAVREVLKAKSSRPASGGGEPSPISVEQSVLKSHVGQAVDLRRALVSSR